MLLATLLASFTPLYLTLSASRIATISTYATGLLVGAALTVIIPEGVEAVYDNRGAGGHTDGEHEGEMAGWVGASLLAGFILMYLIDTLHPHTTPAHPPRSGSRHRASLYRTPSSLAELEPLSVSHSYGLPSDAHETESPRQSFDWDAESRPTSPAPNTPSQPLSASSPRSYSSSSLSTVIGLLAHSLADGISLGAASISAAPGSGGLDLVIFVAIMLHKAPTAFALSSLLVADPSCSPTFIRRSIAAFSFASPVGALITYALLSTVGVEGGGDMGWWTGMALVFSGGTFLFVATHVMERREGEKDEAGTGMTEMRKVGLVLAGMVTPGLLSKLVGHGH
ncbi:solute carrier family 39 (zinc transporter), member 9, partial [Phenoliferia sp. Uapishka_3]